MKNVGPVLDYVSPPATPPRTLTLEEADGRVRVIFAVPPTWHYLLPTVMGFPIGLAYIAAGVQLFRMMWRLLQNRVFKTSPEITAGIWHMVANSLVSLGIGGILWLTAATYHWWLYRRWGRVPRVLAADHDALSYSRLFAWWMRERRWPANEITSVELRPVRWNLNWKRTVADLYIHRRQGRRLHFRLSSPDPKLPSRIADRLANVLGCPPA